MSLSAPSAAPSAPASCDASRPAASAAASRGRCEKCAKHRAVGRPVVVLRIPWRQASSIGRYGARNDNGMHGATLARHAPDTSPHAPPSYLGGETSVLHLLLHTVVAHAKGGRPLLPPPLIRPTHAAAAVAVAPLPALPIDCAADRELPLPRVLRAMFSAIFPPALPLRRLVAALRAAAVVLTFPRLLLLPPLAFLALPPALLPLCLPLLVVQPLP